MNTITLSIPPLLSHELGEQIDAWVNDPSETVTDVDVSAASKVINAMSKNITLTKAESAIVYNELFNLEDKVADWSREYDQYGRREIKWLSVGRSIKRLMAEIRAFGVEVDQRGWAK